MKIVGFDNPGSHRFPSIHEKLGTHKCYFDSLGIHVKTRLDTLGSYTETIGTLDSCVGMFGTLDSREYPDSLGIRTFPSILDIHSNPSVIC